METDQKLDIGVGTEESKLGAKDVEIVEVSIAPATFSGKQVDQLVVMAQHPDKLEPIRLYSIVYRKDKNIKTVGTTIYKDSQGKISKNTAIAELLRTAKAETLRDLKGKKIQTELDDNGYLVIKAY